jgi:DNA-binding response OmpR family regulator
MSTLIVDSTAAILPRLKVLFEERGLPDIVLVKTEARALLETKQSENDALDVISLIIIDSKLEDGDGFELCRQLRKLPAAKDVYIIILISSVENKTAIENARNSGADDFAVKPYDGAEFSKHLGVFLNRRAALLVEDDPVIQKMVQALLVKKNLQAIVVADGMQAYNLINTISPPRIVFMDINLPAMNGVKLLELIRGKNLWRKTPVLMLTGSKEASDVKNSLGAGANDYIVKPFKIADFNQRLEKFIGPVK